MDHSPSVANRCRMKTNVAPRLERISENPVFLPFLCQQKAHGGKISYHMLQFGSDFPPETQQELLKRIKNTTEIRSDVISGFQKHKSCFLIDNVPVDEI